MEISPRGLCSSAIPVIQDTEMTRMRGGLGIRDPARLSWKRIGLRSGCRVKGSLAGFGAVSEPDARPGAPMAPP
jgi:hypothetical protein